MWLGRKKKRRDFFRKVQAEPYQARRFKNPFFQSESRRSRWPFIAIGTVVGLAIALISFFFTAPIFAITSVRVEGAETVNPGEIRKIAETHLDSRVFFIFKRANRFLFNNDQLKEKLEEKYFFSSLEIKREGQGLAIVLEEKISSFLWLTADASYSLDQAGRVIRAVSSEEAKAIVDPPPLFGPTRDGTPMSEPTEILVFHDLAARPVVVGEAVLFETETENTRLFFETMRSAGLIITSFEFNRAVGAWFRAATDGGFDILFDPNSDVSKQADRVLTLLKDQIKDTTVLEYIDVRFGDRVYYK